MKTRKLLVFAACVIMLIAALCAASYAAEVVDSGTCGENLTWTLDSDGVLTISGTGEMTNYGKGDLRPSPWKADSIKLVIISDGVTRIGSSAFYNCTSLTSVTIPDSVSVIGRSAFNGCSSLMSVIIPNGVSAINDWVFCGCTSLNSVKIPDGVTSIGEGAFQDCTSLVSVTIPDSVNTIGNQAFFNCTGLKEIFFSGTEEQWKAIELGSKNELLASSTIHYNSSGSDTNIVDSGTCGENLTWTLDSDGVLTISGTGAMDDFDYHTAPWFNSQVEIKTAIISNGVTTIGSFAFYYCPSLTSVTISDSVTSIGYHAIIECDLLTGIWVSENNPEYSSDSSGVLFNKDKSILVQAPGAIIEYNVPDSVTTIGEDSFYRCESLTGINISNGVTSICDFAFYECKNLTSITIPASVTNIGDYVFLGCKSLSGIWVDDDSCYYSNDSQGALFNKDKTLLIKVPRGLTEYSIPDTVKTIDMYAFECGAFTQLTIPNSVERIDFMAFWYCESLENLIIPDSVTSIDMYAFYGCTSLSSVTFKGDSPRIYEDSFKTVTATAYYPANNPTWTEDKLQNYGGNITWIPYEPASADIITDTVTAFCGEGQTTDVNISYVGEGSISSVRLAIDSALPIASVTSDYNIEYNAEIGWVIIWAENGESFGDSVLLTLHYDLDVDPAYDDGEYAIDIELIEVTDEDEKLIDLTAEGGAVIIENPIKLGDVNKDGSVDNRDVIMIARYLVTLMVFDDEQMILADLNCDGIVNNTDLLLICRYIVGLA